MTNWKKRTRIRRKPGTVKCAQKEVPSVAFSPFIELRERKLNAMTRSCIEGQFLGGRWAMAVSVPRVVGRVARSVGLRDAGCGGTASAV
jgi:hypothetical protein